MRWTGLNRRKVWNVPENNDWKLAGGILLFICLAGIFLYGNRLKGKYVVIQVEGTEYGRYELEKDQIIEINGTNRLEIRDKEAFMSYGDCPDQICVRTGAINAVHELIVCMPNRVVVEICED